MFSTHVLRVLRTNSPINFRSEQNQSQKKGTKIISRKNKAAQLRRSALSTSALLFPIPHPNFSSQTACKRSVLLGCERAAAGGTRHPNSNQNSRSKTQKKEPRSSPEKTKQLSCGVPPSPPAPFFSPILVPISHLKQHDTALFSLGAKGRRQRSQKTQAAKNTKYRLEAPFQGSLCHSRCAQGGSLILLLVFLAARGLCTARARKARQGEVEVRKVQFLVSDIRIMKLQREAC